MLTDEQREMIEDEVTCWIMFGFAGLIAIILIVATIYY
jgi:hypothetical protein